MQMNQYEISKLEIELDFSFQNLRSTTIFISKDNFYKALKISIKQTSQSLRSFEVTKLWWGC